MARLADAIVVDGGDIDDLLARIQPIREELPAFIRAPVVCVPAHIILKTDDLICEKTKNQTNLDVGLSRFIRSKGNLDVASKILY